MYNLIIIYFTNNHQILHEPFFSLFNVFIVITINSNITKKNIYVGLSRILYSKIVQSKDSKLRTKMKIVRKVKSPYLVRYRFVTVLYVKSLDLRKYLLFL